jgi:hypothetical protein
MAVVCGNSYVCGVSAVDAAWDKAINKVLVESIYPVLKEKICVLA